MTVVEFQHDRRAQHNKQNLAEIKQEKKSSASSEKRSSVIEQESEFARVFAQLRGEKRELVY